MILVTGASGFVGGYILQNLVQRGEQVRALVRNGKRPFLADPSIETAVEWFDGDILDVVSLDEAMKGATKVVHAAAMVSFASGDGEMMEKINAEGTANVVNISLDNNIERFIYISSVAALGRTRSGDRVDERKVWQPSPDNTKYALSKHAGEMEVWRGFAEGLNGVILNPSTTLGFGNWHTSSSAALYKNVYKEFPWYTEGVNGFTGVEDLAEITALMLNADVNHERYIVNTDNWSFKKLFESMANELGRKPPVRRANKWMSAIAWRMEGLKSLFSSQKPLLTRETARVALTKTYFDNSKILNALPGFTFTPLETIIKKSSIAYLDALRDGRLTL